MRSDYPLRGRIYDYRNDPFFPTSLPLAIYFGVRDAVAWRIKHVGSLWYTAYGNPRWYKPSNFPNPISNAVNRSLFDPANPGPRDLTRFERIFLWLGF